MGGARHGAGLVRPSPPPPRKYATGEIFPYRGEPLELRVEKEPENFPRGSAKVAVLDGRLLVFAGTPERAGQLLSFWYTGETEKIAGILVPEWSKKLLVRPRSVVVKYARTRWGSCSSNGRIFLNSRLAMLASEVSEYVVVHELCHLKHMNHGKEFWDETRRALPNAAALRRSLREQEREAVL
jgi:predicted metal-dependent hydrolase